jgi:hypothetical protein
MKPVESPKSNGLKKESSIRKLIKKFLNKFLFIYIKEIFCHFDFKFIKKIILLILLVIYYILIFLSIILTSYMIINVILNYFNYDVTTNIRIVNEMPSLFPRVTFCNWNAFTTPASIDYLRHINKQIFPKIDIFDQNDLNKLNSIEKSSIMNEIFQKALSNAKANLSIFEKKKLGHSLDDILLKCSFNNQPCTSKDFTWSFDQIDCNFFSFN